MADPGGETVLRGRGMSAVVFRSHGGCMTYEEFRATVADRAGLPEDQVEPLIRATLSTLADRVSSGEADDVASQLPRQLKEWMTPGTPWAEPLDLETFLRQVARRAGISEEEARKGARAVLTTVRQAISEGEFRDLMSQLPREFEELVDLSVAPAGP
jgi:uncharacterized protein (DUF2267 family)